MKETTLHMQGYKFTPIARKYRAKVRKTTQQQPLEKTLFEPHKKPTSTKPLSANHKNPVPRSHNTTNMKFSEELRPLSAIPKLILPAPATQKISSSIATCHLMTLMVDPNRVPIDRKQLAVQHWLSTIIPPETSHHVSTISIKEL